MLAGVGSTRSRVRLPRAMTLVSRLQRGQALSSTASGDALPHPAFKVLHQRRVEELEVDATLFEHTATGAQLLSLRTEDTHKSFGIAFRTPSPDSTGVAHILEHSVLCGSQKYPLKEPFGELIKSSLQTFLNAMTYPDRTVYPVASQNLQDFYNLTDVYLDAVLHPQLHPLTFQQEGWHVQATDDNKLSFNGVVFNEMKGVYSSPDALNHMAMQTALFPDHAYALSSGGDPRVIPDLTYEQFVHFHRSYYHPSNSMLCFYGDDSEATRLEIADAQLSRFKHDAAAAATDMGFQPKPPAPQSCSAPFPATDSPDGDKHFATLGWVLTHEEPMDRVASAGMQVLDHMLLGNASSPLRKALTDSGLGDSVTGSGFESYLQQPTFTVGLKGLADKAAVEDVRALVLSTLRRVADDGFDADHVAASVSTLEFRLREFTIDGDFPKGVALFLACAPAWAYGRDIVDELEFEAPLAALKQRIADDPQYFQSLVRKYLLDNTHRCTVHLYADNKLTESWDATERARLDAIAAECDADGFDRIRAANAELLQRQQTPDPPEALALVPSLQLSDVDKDVSVIEFEERTTDGYTTLVHDQPTLGIGYVDMLFAANHVPLDLLPLLPVYTKSVFSCGTETMDEEAVSHLIGMHTGGVFASVQLADPSDADTLALKVSCRALRDKATPMADVVQQLLQAPRLDYRRRVETIVRESIAAHEAGVLSSGHRYAQARLNSLYSTGAWAAEQMHGISQLKFLRELLPRVQSDWASVCEDLWTLHHLLAVDDRTLVNLTGDHDTLQRLSNETPRLLESLPSRAGGSTHATQWPDASATAPKQFLAFTGPTQVNYVAKAYPAFQPRDVHGSVDVATNILHMSHLWEAVRVQGGAYGVFCSVNRLSGMAGFGSYRDPQLDNTLAAYDTSSTFLRDPETTADAIRKGALSTIGSADAPVSPHVKGLTSMARYQLGITTEERQRTRDEILGTSPADVLLLADKLEDMKDKASVVVVASAEAVAASTHDFTTESLM